MTDNWIEVGINRTRCNCSTLLEVLFEQVERDIDEANLNHLGKDRGSKFELAKSTDPRELPSFRVDEVPIGGGRPRYILMFENSGSTITIHGSDYANSILVVPQWDSDEEHCNFLVDGQPKKVCEISKLVLEPLFFEEQ